MATFTNYATLSYNGGTTRNSNTVTGELVETISATKTAVSSTYSDNDNVTYVLSLVNSGTAAVTGLTVLDDLGGYTFEGNTVYPLNYVDGSVRYYSNGALQTTPTVTAEPPMTVTGISIPAGGNAMLVYEASVTEYASPEADATITNTATVSGDGLTAPLTAAQTISAASAADLTISKSMCPTVVTENGQLTYTFVIANSGSAAAAATDDIVLSDTFDPILNPITVTFNGTTWAEGTNYTYDSTTGAFSTTAGQITVPAATYTQSTDGSWVVTPGTSTLVITGTV